MISHLMTRLFIVCLFSHLLVSWILGILVFFTLQTFRTFAVLINLNILEGQAGRSVAVVVSPLCLGCPGFESASLKTSAVKLQWELSVLCIWSF